MADTQPELKLRARQVQDRLKDAGVDGDVGIQDGKVYVRLTWNGIDQFMVATAPNRAEIEWLS